MREEVELTDKYIVLEIPEDTLALTITAQVYLNGELQTVEKQLGIREVRAAFKEAEKNYIPDDAVFQITEEGRRYLEERGV
jgi:hypothetical protein